MQRTHFGRVVGHSEVIQLDGLSATRSGERVPQLGFDADLVVHSSANPLFAPEITLGCLDGDVPEKELDLIQFSTRCMAQLRARTPQNRAALLGEARVFSRTVS
jgi:hypothetical protein